MLSKRLLRRSRLIISWKRIFRMRRGIRAEGFMCWPIIIIRAFRGRLLRVDQQEIISQWLIRRISVMANIKTNIKSNIMSNTIKVNCFRKSSDGTQNTPNK